MSCLEATSLSNAYSAFDIITQVVYTRGYERYLSGKANDIWYRFFIQLPIRTLEAENFQNSLPDFPGHLFLRPLTRDDDDYDLCRRCQLMVWEPELGSIWASLPIHQLPLPSYSRHRDPLYQSGSAEDYRPNKPKMSKSFSLHFNSIFRATFQISQGNQYSHDCLRKTCLIGCLITIVLSKTSQVPLIMLIFRFSF